LAQCGIDRIDKLLASSAAAPPIFPGDPEKPAVAIVQDLLSGHGQVGLPDLLHPNYGIFGPVTGKAVRSFRAQQGLPDGEIVDSAALRTMIEKPAPTPILSRAYLTLVLDFLFTSLAKILTLVARMEGAGEFGALNLNTDRAGLSFGLLQWAQRPGRLAQLIAAFQTADPDDFVKIFGGGDPHPANGLLTHLQRPGGGVAPLTGATTDPAFDLIREPWVSRFRRASSTLAFQKVQVETALDSFRQSHAAICRFAPELRSEQCVAFMIDLANQFGNDGARRIYRAVRRKGMAQSELLAAIASESVRRMADEFKAATAARRHCLLTTDLLSDAPLTASDTADQPA
jgi:peptidoglycan hydrolase-like protein with peptidoglycan-binding domain